MIEIEKAFSEATKLVLGTELRHIEEYGNWLGRHVPLPKLAESAISGKDVWIPPTRNFLRTGFNPSKVISMEEMEKVSSSPFTAEQICNATTKEIITRYIKPVAYYCGNFRYRTYENFEKVSGGGDGRNVYYGEDIYLGVKNIAFSNFTLFCENSFGCDGITQSQFCINAYNSTQLARCFEVDGCSNSRDLIFSHNCENVNDSMFCFNAKNLRNAIGNIQFPAGGYRKIKSMILGQITDELQKTKSLKYDIFNIGGSHG